jgi:lipooligosaccharide transport system permease protein
VKGFTLPDGRVVRYAEFVAPAMLAASAMNGAVSESVFNFFFKLKYAKLFEAVLATPVQPFEIALGELFWSLVRGALYALAFLAIMVGMGLTTVGWAVAALPAVLLVNLAFSGLSMMLATYVRGWQDFDYVVVVQFALFMFSGTFAPAQAYPPVMRVLVEASPLYHGVQLVRGLTTGTPGWGLLWHCAYLSVLAVVGLAVAARRTGRLLCP